MSPKALSFLRQGIILGLFAAIPVFSALAAGDGSVGIRNPLNYDTLDGAINAILGILINLGAVILVVFFVYAGFMFVAAQGDPGKLEKARTAFFYTIVGGIILLGAKALSILIQNTLKPILSA